jgi:cobalt-zinc-cadmium efflux system outer membrane protein
MSYEDNMASVQWILSLLTALALFGQFAWAGPLTLEAALSRAQISNPEIAGAVARAEGEHSVIKSRYWLDNPRFGLMQEKNLYLMQGLSGPELGTMSLWSVTQDIKFPTKYFLMGSMQKARAQGADEQAQAKRLEIRKKVISAYYNWFSVSRVIALLEAQREALREVARSAESRHATGAVPQQDEMKAHVEQTRIETDILMAQEELQTDEASLNVLWSEDAAEPIELPEGELAAPKLKLQSLVTGKLAASNSKKVKIAQAMADEASNQKALAGWSFAPDFALSYKKAFSGAPADNYAIGLEVSFPLWFFVKQSGEYSQASSQAIEAEKNLEKAGREVSAGSRTLMAKVRAQSKLLEIYETGLIPQATSTLSSSRAAYRAGRVNFLELLDSERSLYSVRIASYRTLAQYVEYVTQLEELLGKSVSTLPFGENE